MAERKDMVRVLRAWSGRGWGLWNCPALEPTSSSQPLAAQHMDPEGTRDVGPSCKPPLPVLL